MDYRNRCYYLVTIYYCSYDMRLGIFNIAAPSLKINAPYNHFKYNNKHYDGIPTKKLGYSGYWQMMLSCNKKESDALEYELRKAERRDKQGYSYFLKLSKELCGQ